MNSNSNTYEEENKLVKAKLSAITQLLQQAERDKLALHQQIGTMKKAELAMKAEVAMLRTLVEGLGGRVPESKSG